MSDPIARPTFYEGEILPAADLVASVDYPRDQIARHARYLHSWGIVSGLDLQGTDAADASGTRYKAVTLRAGVAIDGSGREIVVPEDVALQPEDLKSQTNPKPQIWYPVFLTGRDEAARASTNLTGACNGSQPTLIRENYDITFGTPGSELNLNQQAAPTVTDGPADGIATDAWRVLLGFVQWSAAIPQFSDVADVSPDSGVGRRYVGLNAAQVVSGSGALLLATHPATFKEQNAIMAVELREGEKDGQLVFGKLNPDGTIAPVLTVKSTGDLIATGQISGAVTPGSMQVQSGVAFDGMTLPLPLGIDPADVAAGKVTLHTHLSLRLDQLQGPTSGGLWTPFPYECYMDRDTRQVHCRVQWWDVSAAPLTAGPILPGLCDYTVIAAVAAT
jgi:hypothetical protein